MHPEQVTSCMADGRCTSDVYCPRPHAMGVPTLAWTIPGGMHLMCTSWYVARPTDSTKGTCTTCVRPFRSSTRPKALCSSDLCTCGFCF